MSKVAAGITRDYVNGIEYNGNDIEMIHMEEGRMIPTGGTSYAYQYFLKDHLGNTRIFMDSDGTAKESSDYYPFGLQVARSGHTSPSPENRYKYNGKELQTEMGLGQYDYGARFYDPVIGRWNVVDPMAEKMSNYSPYTYAFDNPIKYIDVGGEYPWPVTIRSFISSSTTGGGYFYGDGRGASFTGTSRVYSSFVVDPSQGTVSQPITRSDPTVFYGMGLPGQSLYIPSSVGIGKPVGSNDNIWLSDGSASFDFSHAGKDPLTPGFLTPALDLHANLTFKEDLKRGVLSISGSFTGDVFPSSEAFITDQSGAKLFLGAKKEKGGITDLIGNKKNSLFNVEMQVTFDNKGNFTGVRQGEQNYKLEEWFKKIQEEFNK